MRTGTQQAFPGGGAVGSPPAGLSATTADGMLEMEIFRAGDYGAKGCWSEADLELLARDYSPELLEAPLTFDHARTGPAFGWVSRLRRVGDRLIAVLTGVPDVVRELVRQGAYKKRSVEIIRKLAATGRPYLRAVTLLGAATPEVKGLRDIAFDDLAEVVCYDAPEETFEEPKPLVEDTAGRAAELERQLNALRRAFLRKTLEARLARFPHATKRLCPEGVELLLAFVEALEPDSTIRFRGEEFGVEEWLERYLNSGEVTQPLEGEIAGFAGMVSSPPTLAFQERVDPVSVALHERAMALQTSEPRLSYAEALRRVAQHASHPTTGPQSKNVQH